jgi:hypothetical protein
VLGRLVTIISTVLVNVTVISTVLVNVTVISTVLVNVTVIHVTILYAAIRVFEAVVAALLAPCARVLHVSAMKFTGSGRSSHPWMPVIRRSKKLTVVAGFTFVMPLFGKRHPMRFMAPSLFFHCWTHQHSAGTVEAHVNVVHDHVAAINVVHHANVYVENCAVVKECAASPFSPHKAYAAVPEAVVNAAVEADVRRPIATVPAVAAVFKAPIAGRPKHARGRNYPRARNPIIAAILIPSPIPGRPEIAGARAGGLVIDR